MKNDSNIIPFRPAATGLQEDYQTALFSDSEYIKLTPTKLTSPSEFPSDESCEGITLALMILGKEVTQYQMFEEFGCSRLSAYIYELRQLGITWIIDKNCQDRFYRHWHKAEAFHADETGELPPKGVLKRWKKYWLFRDFRGALPPEALGWAIDTFHKWGGHCSGLEVWPDAEA